MSTCHLLKVHNFKNTPKANGYFRMPLKRTYSTSTSIVPTGYQQTKKRRMPMRKRARRYPDQGTVGKPMPFPTRMVAKLKYCETLTLTSALLPIGNLNLACNSIYDPNLTGTGHQPYGHDTYASIYNQYTVLASKITFRFVGSASGLYTWGGGIEDTVGTTSSIDTWGERPTYKLLSGRLPSTENATLSLYWNRNKRFPGKDVYRELSAPFGANPSEIEVFNLVCQTNTGGSTIGTVYCFVEIEYVVEMYEIKDLGDS